MERFFTLDKYNTFLDWDLILTAKDVTPPEPKTYYIDLDGVDGSLDLSEALTGEVAYSNRTVSASFWTDHGTRSDRVLLLGAIRQALHGKKVKIIEPDDPGHYFLGRVKVKEESNNIAYATLSIECNCEPWRYTITDIERTVFVNGDNAVDTVINNNGAKTILPTVTVTGSVTLIYKGETISLTEGTYTISNLRLYQGANVVRVNGTGSVTFTYKEGYI